MALLVTVAVVFVIASYFTEHRLTLLGTALLNSPGHVTPGPIPMVSQAKPKLLDDIIFYTAVPKTGSGLLSLLLKNVAK